MFLIIITFKMKANQASYKYNKITPQNKFHLLTLVLNEGMLIKHAAKIVGINYSTAKTILFFHRNGEKSYQFEFKKQHKAKETIEKVVVSYVDISLYRDDLPQILSQATPIDIISTVGSKNQGLQESKTLSAVKSSVFLEHNQVHREKKAKMEFHDAEKEQQDSISLNCVRPMTRARANRLNNQPSCKIEQEASQGILTVKQQNF